MIGHGRRCQRLSENSICALKPGEIGEVYGQKTLAIPPILSIQMLLSDSLSVHEPRQDFVDFLPVDGMSFGVKHAIVVKKPFLA
jgi:hypothetical protein